MRDTRVRFGLLWPVLVALLVWSAGGSALAQEGVVGQETGTGGDGTGTSTPPTGTDTTTSTDTTGGTAGGDTAAAPDDAAHTGMEDEQAHQEDTAPVAERSDSSPHEERDHGYWFVGAFYRHIFVPSFLLNLFVDASPGANNPAFGGEFTYRRNGFDIVGSVWYALYHGTGPYRASGDPEQDTEIIDSSLSVIFASADFMWSTAFSDYFALEYGVSVGLGVVLGDLIRNEAYQDPNGRYEADGRHYSQCTGMGVPDATYCDLIDKHSTAYSNLREDSVPPVVPWISIPHIALRITPIRNLMIRIDLGFGLGFYTGIAVNYGFGS